MLVTPDWCRMMARYNAWQNEGLLDLVPRLSEEELRRDRGAFWGGILGTLSHLLWADRTWLSRLADHPRPAIGLRDSAGFAPDVVDWAEGRRRADADWLAWAEALPPGGLDGDLTWVSGVTGGAVSRPMGLIATHAFNHQTHHRGQVHAMLTAAGLRPRDTDLFLMPA